MQVLFINNQGSGYADYVDVAEGTTIDQFLEKKLPGHDAGDLLIRINRQPVPRDYVLQNGDRISATPTKIQGAAWPRHSLAVGRACPVTCGNGVSGVAGT